MEQEHWPEPPRLLVEWSSPWEEFKTAIRPALKKSTKALAGEAPVGIFPYRGMLTAWVGECILLIVVIFIPAELAKLNPAPVLPKPTWDVIYYSGDELPQTADRSGAASGRSGSAGGQQAHHRSQTIRVTRGERLVETVVDAPKLKLPRSDSAVANLLAFKSNPGPPPAEGIAAKLVAPQLPAMSAVPPAPDVQAQAKQAQSLNANVVPPTPEVAHERARNTPTPQPKLVAPAPEVTQDKRHALAGLNQNVVAPAPQDPRDLASSRAPVSQAVNAVAPPVSAPARDSTIASKLSLPAPAVVAPPPSQVSRDLNSWGGSRTGQIHAQAVPPPPSFTGGGATSRTSGSGALGSQVVPPPPSSDVRGTQGRGGGGTLTSQVVPPPANLSGAAGSGGGSTQARNAQLGAGTAVPPAPGLGGGTAAAGTGRGKKGAGAGGPLDLGSSVAPPTNAGGNAAGNAVVVSGDPGKTIGLPNKAGTGTIASAPNGTARAGMGGSGGGAGIGNGTGGPGSGLEGEGSGAGKQGTGHGSDPNTRAGISPYPGPGGAGSGTSGPPAVPGVSVEGGTTTVTIPSFADAAKGDLANGPGHSSASNKHGEPGYVIEATPRSGGVFACYGCLRGDRNYSIYIETSGGEVVMQYADPASAEHTSAFALAAPVVMRKELPSGLRNTRVQFTCILDREGQLKNLKVLDAGDSTAEARSKILAALQSWKFRPALRGSVPVEVDAILGFGIDTR